MLECTLKIMNIERKKIVKTLIIGIYVCTIRGVKVGEIKDLL